MPKIYRYINDYIHSIYPNLEPHMRGLNAGQSPETLLLTCSDSRISESVFSSLPGEVFTIRNAGNAISPWHNGIDTSEALTLEYGVRVLKIPHILVCGHRHCGAMNGILNLDSLKDLSCVHASLSRVKNEISPVDPNMSLDELIQWNVKAQIRNLMTYPFVRDYVERGELTIDGAVYDFVDGQFDVFQVEEFAHTKFKVLKANELSGGL